MKTTVRGMYSIEEDINGNPYKSHIFYGYSEDISTIYKALVRNGYKHGLYPLFLDKPQFKDNVVYGIEINTETGDFQVVTSAWIYRVLISENVI